MVHAKSGKNREGNELEEAFDREKNRFASQRGEVVVVRDEIAPNPSRKQREDQSVVDEKKGNHLEVDAIGRERGELGTGKDLERRKGNEGRDEKRWEELIRVLPEFEEKEENLLESEVQPFEPVCRVYF